MYGPTRETGQACAQRAEYARSCMDDFDRLRGHEILHALSTQLYEISRANIVFSMREQDGETLSIELSARQSSNRLLMSQIERLIQQMTNDMTLAA